ncbi:MAG: hypothetical protein WBB25_19640 [Sulfitobacter sp.]
MKKRFDDLKKVPKQPAMRLLAMSNAKLTTKLELPASASVTDVLYALEEEGAFVDMLRLLGVALPARERAWWACLAARDVIGEVEKLPLPLELSESWVRKPNDEIRAKVIQAMDAADNDDETTLCGLCVMYYDDTLGPGNLAKMPGPVGATQAASFGMNIKALGQGDSIPETADVLIDRAVDIARGGNGQLPLPGKQVEEEVQ